MWVKTTAKFRHNIPDVQWDMMDDDEQEEACTVLQFRFDTDLVESYNSTKRGKTTIRLKSGYEQTVEMRVEQLDEIIIKPINDEHN